MSAKSAREVKLIGKEHAVYRPRAGIILSTSALEHDLSLLSVHLLARKRDHALEPTFCRHNPHLSTTKDASSAIFQSLDEVILDSVDESEVDFEFCPGRCLESRNTSFK